MKNISPKNLFLFLPIISLVVFGLSGCNKQKEEIIEQPENQVREEKVQVAEQKEPIAEVDPEMTDLQQSEVDTSNWKTYENKDYGFDFKYPKDWVVEVSDDSKNIYLKKITLSIF